MNLLKKFIFIFLLIFISSCFTNITYWYTDENWNMKKIQFLDVQKNDVFILNSTLSYPSWFVDWTIFNWKWFRKLENQPIWVWRQSWIKWIDDQVLNCNSSSVLDVRKLENRKCFIRHSWMFAKSDISWLVTNFPMSNQLFQVRIDERLNHWWDEQDWFKDAFWFSMVAFWVSPNEWLAHWWQEVSYKILHNWKSTINNQWSAIQAYLLDENWNELTDVWLDIYAKKENDDWTVEYENVTEILWWQDWHRKVVSSINPKLFRWKCLSWTDWVEWNVDAYWNQNCEAFNMIYWLTPKLLIKKSDYSQTRMKWEESRVDTKIPYYQIWFRVIPVVRSKYDWNLYEPSFIADRSKWKLALWAFNRSKSNWAQQVWDNNPVVYWLLEQWAPTIPFNKDWNWFKAYVAEQSNYFAFISDSTLAYEYDWIHKKWFNYNQLMSVLDKNWDVNSINNLSPLSSEYINYNWWFISHQMRWTDNNYKTLRSSQWYSLWEASYIMPSMLWCNIWEWNDWCDQSWQKVVTRSFQVNNFLLKWKLKKWDDSLVIMTLDMDNANSDSWSVPYSNTSIWIASMFDWRMKNVKKAFDLATNWADSWWDMKKVHETIWNAFHNWRIDWITSNYLWEKTLKWTSVWLNKKNPLWKTLIYNEKYLWYVWNDETYNNSQRSIWVYKITNDNWETVEWIDKDNEDNRPYIWFRTKDVSLTNKNDTIEYEFIDKNFQRTNPDSFEYSIEDEWNEESNFWKPTKKITLKGFRHWQWRQYIDESNPTAYKPYRKAWLWFVKIPIEDIVIREKEREKYLECTWEWDSKKCTLKRDYTFFYFISFSDRTNALWYSMSSDFMLWSFPPLPDDQTPVDLNIKFDNLCVFRKSVTDIDPANAYYQLLNADNNCKDIHVINWFSATQVWAEWKRWTDEYNYDWSNSKWRENWLITNPTSPIQAWQKASMEINESNVCDLAFVGKVTASNLNLLWKKIKDLKLNLSSEPRNVEMLLAEDVNVWNRSVKFRSKKLDEELDIHNPILNSLWLLQWKDMEASKRIFDNTISKFQRDTEYWKLKIEACNWDVYDFQWNSDEELLYLTDQAQSESGWVCQYSFEYAFRPITQLCKPMDPEYNKFIKEWNEVSIWESLDDNVLMTKEELQNWETCKTNPEKCASIKHFEPARSSTDKFKNALPFEDMFVWNWWFKVKSLNLCTPSKDDPSQDSCSDHDPVGKVVVFAWVWINVDKIPTIEVTIENLNPDPKCIKWNCPNPRVELPPAPPGSKDTPAIVDVCIKNVDPNRKTLYDARIVKALWNFNIIPSNGLTNTNILWNQMGMWPNHYWNLNYWEKVCKQWLILQKDARNCWTEVTVKFFWEADYKDPTDFKTYSKAEWNTYEFKWRLPECESTSTCTTVAWIQYCEPEDPNETGNIPPTPPDNNPPTQENPDPKTMCIHRWWTMELTKFFKNQTGQPIKNAKISYEIDKNSYVYSQWDFSRNPTTWRYEKTFLNVWADSSTALSTIIIWVKDWVRSWTKIVVKETAIFESMDGNIYTIVNDRQSVYGWGRPWEVCEPDSLKDFITLELPKKPIWEIPLDPDPSIWIPPTPPENPNIPFNEIPSKDIPSDGWKIKNCNLNTDWKAPSSITTWWTYCTQNPWRNNDWEDMREIWDVCAIYNPTAKTWLNWTWNNNDTSWEASLPKEMPVTRVVKANYYRVEADPISLNSSYHKIFWKNGPWSLWWSVLQLDSYDYLNWARDLNQNQHRIVYKNPYIDWTIELPCQVKLASEYFWSNDTGDQRWSFQILEKNENRTHRNWQLTCKQKVYKVRQFIKTKWSWYDQPYYETNQHDNFVDEVQKRIEWNSEVLTTEFKNQNVFRYITFAITPDNENWRQKIDSVKDWNDLNNYIKVQWQLWATRIYRQVVDEAYTQPGKTNSEWYRCSWRPRNWYYDDSYTYTVCSKNWWCSTRCATTRSEQLDYHRDKLIKIDDFKAEAEWRSSARIWSSGWYWSTYKNNFNETNVILKTEWKKALLLHDICNPWAALCVLWWDVYSQNKINLSKAVFDYRLPWEFSFISWGWIQLSNKRDKTEENKTIYWNNINIAFEDPTWTRAEKVIKPQLYCDYIDSTWKVNPELDQNWNCKTTYFEDLKTWRKWWVKKVEQQKWITDLNLSDPDNPTKPTTAKDYKATSWQDIVWHVEWDLVIGDHPTKWINVRWKWTVFVEWDLYINSNMQYVTNSVSDIKNAFKIDSAAFIVKWNIFVAPEVTSTVWVLAAMWPKSEFFSCGDTSKDRQNWYLEWTTSCTSRTPLLIQQLVARKINFDRLASNVPLYVKKTKLVIDTTLWDHCTWADINEQKNPECYVDKCIEAKNHLEDPNWCFETIQQLTSAECLINDNRNILNPPSALNETWSKFKRIEIAPGENTYWSIYDKF